MSETAIRPALDPFPGPPAPSEAPKKPLPRTGWGWKVLSVAASLRVTVVLFTFAIFLVFLGTIAYKDAGMETVQEAYFRSWTIVWIPLQVFVRFGQVFFGVSPSVHASGSIPYPGGWLLGGLLLVNLLAAHVMRFKLNWKRTGILLTHAGLIVLMLNELITGLFAREGQMEIPVNQTANCVIDTKDSELAVIDSSKPGKDKVVTVPGWLLRRGDKVQHPDLPFDLVVHQYMVNSDAPEPVQPGQVNLANAGDGVKFTIREKPENPGTNSATDLPSAYVTFVDKHSGRQLGTYLLTVWWSDYWLQGYIERPQKVTADGKEYQVFLRFQRVYKPYSIQLLEFHHDTYEGTDTAKNYSSRVRLTDPSTGAERETLIYMNHPLRYEGQTFYQAGVLFGDRGTVLQVVKNPSYLGPYIGCGMVALGLLLHFGLHLFGFLRRRVAS